MLLASDIEAFESLESKVSTANFVTFDCATVLVQFLSILRASKMTESKKLELNVNFKTVVAV